MNFRGGVEFDRNGAALGQPFVLLTVSAITKITQLTGLAWQTIDITQRETAGIFALSMIICHLHKDRTKKLPGLTTGERRALSV